MRFLRCRGITCNQCPTARWEETGTSVVDGLSCESAPRATG
jgi:hypothetical protein